MHRTINQLAELATLDDDVEFWSHAASMLVALAGELAHRWRLHPHDAYDAAHDALDAWRAKPPAQRSAAMLTTIVVRTAQRTRVRMAAPLGTQDPPAPTPGPEDTILSAAAAELVEELRRTSPMLGRLAEATVEDADGRTIAGVMRSLGGRDRARTLLRRALGQRGFQGV